MRLLAPEIQFSGNPLHNDTNYLEETFQWLKESNCSNTGNKEVYLLLQKVCP